MPEAGASQMQASMRIFPEERTVKSLMVTWKATNGNSDPREMLDRYFWSHLHGAIYSSSEHFREIEAWCDQMIGEDNWYRMFNKFWFTSEEYLVVFKLTWGRG